MRHQHIGHRLFVDRFEHKWIKPQLTRLADEARTGKDWLHEIKDNGYRMCARLDRGRGGRSTGDAQPWTVGSILRYPPLSMIQGCSRYGGSSSAAVLGSKMGGGTSNAALLSFVGRSSLVIREYAFMRPLPSRSSFAFGMV